jgi:diketogulonate reductase-like aldo/keto reductase
MAPALPGALRRISMAHEVKLKVNTNVVGYKDVETSVKDSAGKLGTLLISRGSIEWRPAWKIVKKHRFTWAQFADRMAEGKTVRAKR